MPVDINLDFNFSPANQAAIHAGFDAVLAVLNDPNIPYVNLTKSERKSCSTIGPKRMAYVQDAVNNLVPEFPNLASPSIAISRTTTLFELVAFIATIAPKMAEINDRLTDMGLNAEKIVFLSMRDSYGLAKMQEGRMPGADVLMAAIAPLFAPSGSNVSTPPAP